MKQVLQILFVAVLACAGKPVPAATTRSVNFMASNHPTRADVKSAILNPQSAIPRDLDTHHLFTLPSSRTAWEARKKELKRQILFSAGLWPMPKKTPLHPRVTGRIEGPDYV